MLHTLPDAARETLTGKTFFPDLLAGPFHDGLVVVFSVTAVLSVFASLASTQRGGRYVHVEEGELDFLDPHVPAPARDR